MQRRGSDSPSKPGHGLALDSSFGLRGPSPSDFGGVDHATGATDVLLRFDQGGGFVMPAFLATSAPIFTLYGDGTIIFRNPSLEGP